VKRDVVRVIEVEGPRGGVLLVHLLDCGHWFWRRGRAVTHAPCMACAIASRLADLFAR